MTRDCQPSSGNFSIRCFLSLVRQFQLPLCGINNLHRFLYGRKLKYILPIGNTKISQQSALINWSLPCTAESAPWDLQWALLNMHSIHWFMQGRKSKWILNGLLYLEPATRLFLRGVTWELGDLLLNGGLASACIHLTRMDGWLQDRGGLEGCFNLWIIRTFIH